MARFQLQRRRDVSFIALAGVAAETGVTILIYLDPSACGREGSGRRAKTACSGAPIFHAAIMEGAVEPSVPKMMTVADISRPGSSHGVGSEVMQRIATSDDPRNALLDHPHAPHYSGYLRPAQSEWRPDGWFRRNSASSRSLG
jgi:hypothetical protein